MMRNLYILLVHSDGEENWLKSLISGEGFEDIWVPMNLNFDLQGNRYSGKNEILTYMPHTLRLI